MRLAQLGALLAGGVEAEARIDPVLPKLTDSPEVLADHFAALAAVGVKRAAAGVLFLRPGILHWLKRSVKQRELLDPLIEGYQAASWKNMRGSPWPVQSAPAEIRAAIFERLETAANAASIDLNICACKNQDIARGTCNIAGKWPTRTPVARQATLALA